jgi:hypothetical protein
MAKKVREPEGVRDIEIRRPTDSVIMRSRIRNIDELELRVTAALSREIKTALDAEVRKTGKTRSRIVRDVLENYFENGAKQGDKPDISTADGKVVIRSKKQTMLQVTVILDALQQTIDFDPVRHHNQPPPPLRIENPEYLTELRNLVEQLRRLNETLGATKQTRSGAPAVSAKDVTKPAIDSRKAISKFVNNYAGTLGKTLGYGSGALVLGGLASLLYQLGLPDDVFATILKKIR